QVDVSERALRHHRRFRSRLDAGRRKGRGALSLCFGSDPVFFGWERDAVFAVTIALDEDGLGKGRLVAFERGDGNLHTRGATGRLAAGDTTHHHGAGRAFEPGVHGITA